MMVVYRIAKWNDVFERAESRKLKQLTWIALPVGFSSTGYQSLLEEFEDDAPGLYGAWCVLVSFSATCHIRGLLVNSRGLPIKLSHIARVTGFPVSIFEQLVAWTSRTDVGWLECVSADGLSRLLLENAENTRDFNTSGDSPDDPPTCRGNPPYTRPNRTEPNQTRQDITQQHRTEPNRTPRDQGTSVDWSVRWSAANVEVGFFERVAEVAKRLSQLKTKLDREFVWQVAWVGCEFDRDAVNDACDRCRIPGEVLKPKQYLGAVMVKLCDRNGEYWDSLKKLVPPCPPPPKHASVPDALEATA